MGHVRTPQADSDLDEIWLYAASKSGSVEIADRFIESVTDRFSLLAKHPNIGRSRDRLGTASVSESVIVHLRNAATRRFPPQPRHQRAANLHILPPRCISHVQRHQPFSNRETLLGQR